MRRNLFQICRHLCLRGGCCPGGGCHCRCLGKQTVSEKNTDSVIHRKRLRIEGVLLLTREGDVVGISVTEVGTIVVTFVGNSVIERVGL